MNLEPLRWNLPFVKKGATYPAVNFKETAAESDLASVVVKVSSSKTATPALTLSSATSGITINSATAGDWDFDIDQIDAVALDPDIYIWQMWTTDDAGTITPEFEGTWEIGFELPDA